MSELMLGVCARRGGIRTAGLVHQRKSICPEYSFGFDEFGHKMAVLVGTERMSGLFLAAAIPVKGSDGRYTLDKAYMVQVGSRARGDVVRHLVEARAERNVFNQSLGAWEGSENGVKDAEKHGCGSCFRGEGKQPHTDECRD